MKVCDGLYMLALVYFCGDPIEEPRDLRRGEFEIDLLRMESMLLWISESIVS